MATLVGAQVGNRIPEPTSTKGRFVAWTGNITRAPVGKLFKLSAIDSATVRHYWNSVSISFAEAPNLGVGITWVGPSLSIEVTFV